MKEPAPAPEWDSESSARLIAAVPDDGETFYWGRHMRERYRDEMDVRTPKGDKLTCKDAFEEGVGDHGGPVVVWSEKGWVKYGNHKLDE